MIDKQALKKNTLIVKTSNNQYRFGPGQVSSSARDFLIHFLEDPEALSLEVYDRLLNEAKFNSFFIVRCLGVRRDIPDYREDVQNQFYVLRGSIEAGNDNRSILFQLKHTLQVMIALRMINNVNANRMLANLV
jgi:hypothetical protein